MGRVRVPAPSFPVPGVLWVPHAPPSRVGLLPFPLAGAASFPLLIHGKGAASGPVFSGSGGSLGAPCAALARGSFAFSFRGYRILPAFAAWEGCGFRPSAAFSAWFILAGAASFPLLVHGKGAGSGPVFSAVRPPPASFYSVIPSDAGESSPRVDAPRDPHFPRRKIPSSLPPFPPSPPV